MGGQECGRLLNGLVLIVDLIFWFVWQAIVKEMMESWAQRTAAIIHYSTLKYPFSILILRITKKKSGHLNFFEQ